MPGKSIGIKETKDITYIIKQKVGGIKALGKNNRSNSLTKTEVKPLNMISVTVRNIKHIEKSKKRNKIKKILKN